MSLVKQLWLATSVLILTAFLASLAASLLSAQSYYEDQLSLKNIDSANSLALTLSHTEKETALLRSYLDAQFATGHYQRITLSAVDGQSVELRSDITDHPAPRWFTAVFSLDVPAGVATVSDGWMNYGKLSIESDTTYAQMSLWVTSKRVFLWLALVALLAGLAGSWMVRRISRPLNEVVQQAEAIGEKRFIVSNEPRTTEFRRVVRAMNKLSLRVERILDTEAKNLAEMRQKALYDPVTNVANREFFLSRLDSLIDDPEPDTRHTLILARVAGLTDLNNEYGRERVNADLKAMCQTLPETLQAGGLPFEECFMGRLNGSDFAVVMTGFHDTNDISKALDVELGGVLAPSIRLSICAFQDGTSHAETLMKADHLLAKAEQSGDRIACDTEDLEEIPFRNTTEWRDAISSALREGALNAAFYPLNDQNGLPLQLEAKVRLKLDGQWRAAGFFLPWGRRLGLLPDVDIAMIRHLSEFPAGLESTPVVAHISTETFLQEQCRHQILEQLRNRQLPALALRLELSESVLTEGEFPLKAFVHEVQALGSQVGISGVGQNLERIARVHELGLDYLKTEPVYGQQIESDAATQMYLQRLTALAHGIGVKVYLAGVKSDAGIRAAWNVGMDGVTGPGVKAGV